MQVIGLHHEMASPALTAAAHEAGQEVHVWTTNTARMVRRALWAATDALVTDLPTETAQQVNEAWKLCNKGD